MFGCEGKSQVNRKQLRIFFALSFVTVFFFAQAGFADQQILGIWEGLESDGDAIQMEFLANGRVVGQWEESVSVDDCLNPFVWDFNTTYTHDPISGNITFVYFTDFKYCVDSNYKLEIVSEPVGFTANMTDCENINGNYHFKVSDTDQYGSPVNTIYRKIGTWSVSKTSNPQQATNPIPSNSASEQSVFSTLSWSNGGGACSYNVYFGECGDMELVSSEQTETTFDPGPLNSCTTYCWRIDAINASGVNYGQQWSFSTNGTTPDVHNMTQVEAENYIVDSGYIVGNITSDYNDTVAEGSVLDQDPEGGDTLSCGSSIDLVVSKGSFWGKPDLNGDGQVTLADYGILAAWWMHNDCNPTNEWCDGADLSLTDSIEETDLHMMSEYWLADFTRILEPDLNYDKYVTFEDFSLLSNWWMHEDCSPPNVWCDRGDLDLSHTLNKTDLQIMSEYWLEDFSITGYWPMDDDADNTVVDDVSRNDNDGTSQIQTFVMHTTGKVDGALEFNGSSDYVDIGDVTILDNLETLSIGCWIKPYDNKNSDIVIKNAPIFFYMTSDRRINARVFTSESWSDLATSTDTVELNQWTNVYMTYDGSNVQIYINGVPQTPVAHTGPTQDSADTLTIGYGEVKGYFEGAIDDVRIHDKALTADEILNIMGE